MSWLDFKGFVRLGALCAMALALSACFRPLYGPTASGERLDGVLSGIEVAGIVVPQPYERVSHYLRSELVYDLNGSGVPAPKRYKLALDFGQQVQSPIVDTTTGRAQSATVTGTVNYTLTTLDGSRTVTSGIATGYVNYDRSPQRFASVRAARDADIRLAKTLAEQIKIRLAAALSAAS
jgi:LPS-assembly lipoprotein